jgi:hypothetical protein
MSHPFHPPQKICGEEHQHEAPVYTLFSFPNNSYVFGPNISLSTLFSKTISVCFFLNVKRPGFTPTHNRQSYISSYLTLHTVRRPTLSEFALLNKLGAVKVQVGFSAPAKAQIPPQEHPPPTPHSLKKRFNFLKLLRALRVARMNTRSRCQTL